MVKPWCKIKICGYRDCTVQAATTLPEGNAGEYSYRRGLIRVMFAERTYMLDTLLHEVTHAVWEASGLKDGLRRKWGHLLTTDQLRDLEEDVLVAQTPGLLTTLTQAGWLKLPEPPKKER